MSDATVPAQPEPTPGPPDSVVPANEPVDAGPSSDPDGTEATQATEPAETAVEPAVAPQAASPAIVGSGTADEGEKASGHPHGTILKAAEGVWEKIVHDWDEIRGQDENGNDTGTPVRLFLGWHKEPVNEDGSPNPRAPGVETEDITPAEGKADG